MVRRPLLGCFEVQGLSSLFIHPRSLRSTKEGTCMEKTITTSERYRVRLNRVVAYNSRSVPPITPCLP